MKPDVLEAVIAARAGKEPVVLLTALESGDQALLGADGSIRVGTFAVPREAVDAVAHALHTDRATTIESESEQVFVQPFSPPLRLIVIGAVHIAQVLAPMAAFAGYDVTIIDPRRAFASAERFPGISLVTDWPDDALDSLKPDARTALVTLSHDPKLDDPALDRALGSTVFYIAALGSRRSHAARRARLEARGFGPAALDRVHGPAGLPIGAATPAEIAISILAQMTDILRNRR